MLRLYTCLTERHDLALVALAILVCAIGVLTTFVLVAVAERQRRWFAVAALTCGTAVWAMHFISMLAFRPGVVVGYDPLLTLASLALPILVAKLALRLAAGDAGWRAPAGGALLGLGIVAMH